MSAIASATPSASAPSAPLLGAVVIGLGSRGLGVLERIVTLTSRPHWRQRPFTLDLVDPRADGAGLHDPEQPDHLLLNTVACQVSPFPEETTVGDTVGDRGPNLYEWVRARGLRLGDDGRTLGPAGREVRPDDYLPRRVLGEYLTWYLRRTLRRAPAHLDIRLHRATAVALADAPGGARAVTLDDGTVLRRPFVFLTTGHTPHGETPDPGDPHDEAAAPARATSPATAAHDDGRGGHAPHEGPLETAPRAATAAGPGTRTDGRTRHTPHEGPPETTGPGETAAPPAPGIRADGLTGHTPPGQRAHRVGGRRRIADIYPPARKFADVAPGQTVALAGTGLSSMDAVASLTVGRGGRYTADGGVRRYVPSGDEPRILLFSRTGLPFRARPRLHRPGGAFEPLVFHQAGVDRLRSAAPSGQLSLYGDVLPLLCAEMRIAYHRRCALLAGGGPEAARRTTARLRAAVADGSLGRELDELDAQHADRFGVFDPYAVLFPDIAGTTAVAVTADSGAYQEWYRERLVDDLIEARLGLSGSPLKSALEVLRDQREVIRYAVDFGGLDEKSHEEFYGRFTSVLNRSVTGPQRERHEELLALLDAGVVAVPFGPGPRADWDEEAGVWRITSTALAEPYGESADWLAHATSGQPDVERTGSALLAGMLAAGRIRRHRPEAPSSRGVDITPGQHPVAADGTADERIWILGPLCEGATFYNHYVPSPGGVNRALLDAHCCVTAMLDAAARMATRAAVMPSMSQTATGPTAISPPAQHDDRPLAEAEAAR
ncbi:FAD/NAD(P)-binding protein [Streptomyces sp. PR69]|uniref:FAD/NAD(P)-binding protein n=1 Tax=Streptomyces sp. PR69 TaxID=2984950 RepID=UPI002263B356|nr:FAD/NAD(P)-binding protein [Streptomyces sp. PR69]